MGDDGFNIRFLGNIADLGLDLEILCALDYFMQLGYGPLKRWAGNIREEDIGTLTCEENRSLETDTAG